MSTAFYKGQQLGREDLNIFLVSSSDVPVNAAEISYALYDYTTGMEVLLGPAKRTPVNPSVGEYYSSIIIPLDANIGSYRIRWTFRQSVGAAIQQVLQEFEVVDKVTASLMGTSTFTQIESDLMRRLRILLRDNCVGGEEEVELDVGGEKMVVTIRDLYEAIHGTTPAP
jgi:hypothetical protein